MINVKDLRATTNEAIRTAEAARVARQLAESQARLAESDRIRRETDLKAERILAQVPSRCATEAAAGRGHAIVMSLTSRYGRGVLDGLYDYDSTKVHGANVIDPASLCGPGRVVYDSLVAASIQVTIEYWHDGVGVESGYNLVVHW